MFLQGLNSAASLRGLPEDFSLTVKRFFALHGAPDLMPIAQSVVKKKSSDADERALLQAHVQAHVSELAKALADL